MENVINLVVIPWQESGIKHPHFEIPTGTLQNLLESFSLSSQSCMPNTMRQHMNTV